MLFLFLSSTRLSLRPARKVRRQLCQHIGRPLQTMSAEDGTMRSSSGSGSANLASGRSSGSRSKPQVRDTAMERRCFSVVVVVVVE